MQLSIVIVLYKQALADSTAYRWVAKLNENRAPTATADRPTVYVWDNSPEPQAMPKVPFGLHYHHDPGNGGLVPAYNWAWREAMKNDHEWLLLLDQDADPPLDYLKRFLAVHPYLPGDVAAVVPKLTANGRQISPLFVTIGTPSGGPVDQGFSGAMDREISAVNAGSFVRISHLAEIDGYPTQYSLDAVDFWFYADLYARGRRAFVLSCWFEHALSVADLASLSTERWRSILTAEADFYMHMRPRYVQAIIAAMIFQRTYTFLSGGLYRMAGMNVLSAGRIARHCLAGR